MSASKKNSSKIEQEPSNEEVMQNQEVDKKKKILPKAAQFSFNFLSVIFTILSVGAKFILVLFDIFIPQALREYVPFLNMLRQTTLSVSELFAGKKSKEVVEVSKELDNLVINQQKLKKAYPLRRGIGQAISMGISPILLILVPTIIWGESLILIIQGWFPALPRIVIILMIGTIMLLLSFISTVFGPIYVIFHETSKNMLRLGAYRWAGIYQDLENFFSLPYYAVRSSFSFFDAPPISSETFEEFKIELLEEAETIKEKVQGLLAMDVKEVPERSKEMLEKLLRKAEIPLEKLDLTKITQKTSRTFALLIWSKESSVLPWRREEALERFALNNKLKEEDAEKALQEIVLKVKNNEIDDYTLKVLMINGALKGIANQEKKYKQIMTDIEYNKLAISLALGAQQYLVDIFKILPIWVSILKGIGVSLLAILMPFILIIFALLLYVKHIIFTLVKTIFSKKTLGVPRLIIKRFQEINTAFTDTYFSVVEKGKKFNLKKDMDIDFGKFFKKTGKVLLKIILFVPLLLWSFLRSMYKRIYKLWERRKLENKLKRMFEKEIATESLVSMYQEIYDKFIISEVVLS
ncbi:MAG: hypothetical protein ACFFDS_07210 [Candidatus Thorarchaeota archaeon]